MNSTTLRGVFPEPKPAPKRNFIKENVRHIKQMQGILQNSGFIEGRPERSRSISRALVKSSQNIPQTRSMAVPKSQKPLRPKPPDAKKGKGLPPSEPAFEFERQKERGVQTEAADTSGGVIKYPSPHILKTINSRRTPSPRKDYGVFGNQQSRSPPRDRGDASNITSNAIEESPNSSDPAEKHNYIKENILALKQRSSRFDTADESKLKNYQKGVVPKYLRDRKEERKEPEPDKECPDGHVLLPDEERRETLRVLRQSYADRIQELNSMPVRNDTLRMRNRKIAIEEELKKIDEGIKVFQRPKVYVKINA